MKIEIEFEGTPPTGTVHPTDPSEQTQRFVGWLGLLRALSAIAGEGDGAGRGHERTGGSTSCP